MMVIAAGCKTTDPCKTEYASTIMECDKPKRIQTDTVLVCETKPGSRFKECVRISRDELRQILRSR